MAIVDKARRRQRFNHLNALLPAAGNMGIALCQHNAADGAQQMLAQLTRRAVAGYIHHSEVGTA
ncbi:hypothetical protein FCN45_21635 (plasmid) [Pantoea sp. SO10]|nr:hypothetical protein FCN45_21635 [Pantoea sp. SO10]